MRLTCIRTSKDTLPEMARILHYTWVDPADPAKRGGGVRLYVAALAQAQRRAGHEVVTLSSGLAQTIRARAPYWVKRRAGHYEIVNSGALSPSQADFATARQVTHRQTETAFADFLRDCGPFDIAHFHGLEGLPARALEACAHHSAMRVVLSLHNYHPFCPQVNLWYQEQAHCADYQGGKNCKTCLPVTPNPRAVRLAYALETLGARVGAGAGSAAHRRILMPAMKLGWQVLKRLRRPAHHHPPAPDATTARNPYQLRREAFATLINQHCDVTLAVSDRTAQIARGFGLRHVETCRIGTPHAVKWHSTQPRHAPQNNITLSYLGYMRRDKGFGFMLDALAKLPDAMANRIRLRVAAQRGAPEFMREMAALRPKLADLIWQDGYDHAQLDTLLHDTDFGLVPVLWEDNLPQTALEMHARHIPLITSDRGGAQELLGDPNLIFRAGDAGDFARALAYAQTSFDAAQYWAKAPAPTDMATHIAELDGIYAREKVVR